ncbi:hypothetical protein EUA03_10995 [Mycolicibacterium mucogenicum]|uniref:Uncharacterized protein n=1 Tax=Mycolicibacterium mucogenicum TaxID=56689 RepID=A0A4V3AWD7_MYCMU|nr:hypothetical protein EUA03_10995 [Mycolicibacterium mucogenicum]
MRECQDRFGLRVHSNVVRQFRGNGMCVLVGADEDEPLRLAIEPTEDAGQPAGRVVVIESRRDDGPRLVGTRDNGAPP